MIELAGVPIGFLTAIGAIPTMGKLHRTKDVYNVSVRTYSVFFAIVLCYTAYGIIIEHSLLTIICGISTILNGLLIYQYIRYSRFP